MEKYSFPLKFILVVPGKVANIHSLFFLCHSRLDFSAPQLVQLVRRRLTNQEKLIYVRPGGIFPFSYSLLIYLFSSSFSYVWVEFTGRMWNHTESHELLALARKAQQFTQKEHWLAQLTDLGEVWINLLKSRSNFELLFNIQLSFTDCKSGKRKAFGKLLYSEKANMQREQFRWTKIHVC